MSSGTVNDFQIGSVIGRGISVFFRNIVAFVLVTIVIFIVPIVLTVFVFGAIGSGLGGILTMLLWFIAYFWLSAALVYGVVSDLRGNRASVGQILSGALSVLIPVFFVSIVVGLLVAVGTLALIIPGIILYVMFWVAVPAAVVERTGIGDSMRRSLELTKGYRWQIFFVMVIWVVISFIVQLIVGFIVGVPLGATSDMTAAAHIPVAGLLITQIVNMLLSGVSASILAVGYHDLRVAKEGIGSEEIARTFD
ncbi:MAG: hypothetical protein AAF563_05680 [Pseudomonadota bacterium]